MRILSVGGGSGGHVTPVVAVIKELKKRHPDLEARFICDRKFFKQSNDLFADIDVPVSVVVSGKLRRYANLKWSDHVRHLFKTHFRNLIDMFKVGIGFIQSFWKLVWWRPDVVFAKGGFVCLPVGMAAHILRIPLVIHDSDTHPGLTNRVLARYAKSIGTGAPTQYYPSYPKNRTRFVGVPISEAFHKFSANERRAGKEFFGFKPDRPLVVVMGGGLGAEAINNAMLAITPKIIDNTQVFHVTGQAKYENFVSRAPVRNGYKIVPFESEHIAQLVGVSDIVVTRAGATTMAELAAACAAVILVPSPYLAGNHQMKNAQIYDDAHAAISLDEREFGSTAKPLLDTITKLLANDELRRELSDNLSKFAKPNALNDMADMIEEAVK